MYCSSSSVFMVAGKNITKVLNQKLTKWPKCFSSDSLVQYCVTLKRWFSHKTVAFYPEQCTSPSSLFLNFQNSSHLTKCPKDILNCDFAWDTICYSYAWPQNAVTMVEDHVKSESILRVCLPVLFRFISVLFHHFHSGFYRLLE